MTIFFQDKDTEDVLFKTEECIVPPCVGDFVNIDNIWYVVAEKDFYCNNGISCTIWITAVQQ